MALQGRHSGGFVRLPPTLGDYKVAFDLWAIGRLAADLGAIGRLATDLGAIGRLAADLGQLGGLPLTWGNWKACH